MSVINTVRSLLPFLAKFTVIFRGIYFVKTIKPVRISQDDSTQGVIYINGNAENALTSISVEAWRGNSDNFETHRQCLLTKDQAQSYKERRSGK